MKSLSGVGLGLSIVFGCLLLALIAELYYLLWWKKRLTSRDLENDYANPARELFYMFCLKSSSSSLSSMATSALNPQEIRVAEDQQCLHHHLQSSKDLLLKSFDDHRGQGHGHGMENELMRLSGPPRLLFTIVEETKEDLESEETKSRRGRSLSDVALTVETPYLTPLASPPFFTPPHAPPMDAGCHSQQQGFNPLFESATDAEFNRIRSSPPPKFKFLQEAEEKLHRKTLVEEGVDKNDGLVEENGDMTPPLNYLKDEEDESFITIIVDRNKERGINQFNHHNHQHQFHSSSTSTSQVLPLISSPSTFKSPAAGHGYSHI